MTDLYDSEGRRLYLNPAERLRFYEAVEGIENLAHKSLCMLILYTGCRVSEAVSLRRRHIDVEDETVVFKTLKQRNQNEGSNKKSKTTRIRRRALPMPDWLVDLLLEQAPHHPDGKLWNVHRSTALRWVKKHANDIGLDGEKATCKGLRHAFAIDNASQSVPLSTISKWLGHAKLENTKIYLNFVGSEERALAQRAWLHLRSNIPAVSSTPATTVTEIQGFDFNGDASNGIEGMNAHIKKREASGWSVSQVEQLTEANEHGQACTMGMMVVFVKHSPAVQNG